MYLKLTFNACPFCKKLSVYNYSSNFFLCCMYMIPIETMLAIQKQTLAK